MAKVMKILGVFVLIGLLVGFCVAYIMVIKPNSDYQKNRNSLEVSTADRASGQDFIHFLPTGSSDAILIESNGKFALVDCAEDSDNPRGFEELVYDGYEQQVLDYLKKVATAPDGKVHLDFVVGTHSHSDHIGGFDTIIADENVVVDRAYLKEYDETKIDLHEVEAWDNKEVYTQMVDALNAKNVPIISQISEPSFALGDFNITLFNTQYDQSGQLVGENDNSLGVLVEKNGAKVFLAGDIDNKSGDEDMLKDQIGKVDILKVGHHSYSQSTSVPWLKTLMPRVCVVTNDYEKTDKRTLRKITRICKSPILVTGAENGVLVSIDDKGNITYFNNI